MSIDDPLKKGAKSWLKKLGVLTHVLRVYSFHHWRELPTYKKQFKELSSLCIDQEFSAHDGSILAMKLYPDGKYIASAGEDCVVRISSITEEERTDKYEVAEVDSGVYFGMNQHSQIEFLKINNEKIEKKAASFVRKLSDSTCVVLPSKIFSISDKPRLLIFCISDNQRQKDHSEVRSNGVYFAAEVLNLEDEFEL